MEEIRFFAVGGTIDKVYFDALSKYEVGESNISGILKNARVGFKYKVSSLLKKDSLEMTDDDRQLILRAVQKVPCRQIIVTHGTDTMVETAKVLNQIADKSIVLTGAMEPAKFKTSDAVFNLGLAVAAVQTLPAGAYIAISGRVFSPENVIKNRDNKQFEEKM